ncbi:PP2C-domain-containing protein [Pluteus cervinus]|uniref:PP2C-domain-containing protein n=1 Tax=Pluteus cervinus TaxID=181527 RepID=A0ACD3BAY4_9AGAR|nr:PP2C-domain-containing protein [Pluteus cervinus]
MGQTLSSPATQKSTETGGNHQYLYAVSEMQGWRITMEDAHAAVLDLDEDGSGSHTFFAVYDGHGGGTVAKFAGQHVHKRLVQDETYRKGEFAAAMKRAFLGTDEDLLANPAHTRDPSGCTAVAALLTKDGKIYVANAGDSRTVIGVKGQVKPLSFDHKPSNETERARISAAGGYIEYGRVNGNLALSRALGDFEFKKNYSLPAEKQVITADPDVTCHEITEEDEFLVLACDGIWDCLSSQQVVDFVRLQVSLGKELSEIGEMMCDHCLAPDTSSGAGIGCDNMTVLIVALLHGRTKEEWYSWVTDRVKNEYGYKTPTVPPTLYSQSRLMAFRARKEAQEARARDDPDDQQHPASVFLGGSGLSGFARILGSTGGISFHPGSGIMNDAGGLMFANDEESEEDESGDESHANHPYYNETVGLGRAPNSDATQSLKARIHELENDDEEDAQMVEVIDGSNVLQGEAPPPPITHTNGDAKVVTPVEQLHSLPGGDEASPAVKAEGFLDGSEDPLKT